MSIHKEAWLVVSDERKIRDLALRSTRGDVPSFMEFLREYDRGRVPLPVAQEVINSLIPHNSEISRAVWMDDSALDIVLRYLGDDVEDFDPEILEWLPSEVNSSTPVSYMKWLTHQGEDFIIDQIPGWEGEYFGDGEWGPGFYDHVLDAAYKSMDLELLRWVWEDDSYRFKGGEFPKVYGAQVLVTPAELLPDVDVVYTYYSMPVTVNSDNHVVSYGDWYNDEGDKQSLNLRDFASRIKDFSWERLGRDWVLLSDESGPDSYSELEPSEEDGPEEDGPEEDDSEEDFSPWSSETQEGREGFIHQTKIEIREPSWFMEWLLDVFN